MSDSSQSPLRPVVGVQVVVRDRRNILLGRREGGFGAGTWGLPGGHLEFGESFEEAAARELSEETGLLARQLRTITSINTPYKKSHYVQIAVEVYRYDGVVENREPDKCSGLSFFPISELPTPLFPPSIRLIEYLRDRDRLETVPDPNLCIYLHRHDRAENVDKYVNYILLGGSKTILVIKSGRRGERRPRRERVLPCRDMQFALDMLREDIPARLQRGYLLYDCSGAISLDLARSLFPRTHRVGFRSVPPGEGISQLVYDSISISEWQMPLFKFGVDGGVED